MMAFQNKNKTKVTIKLSEDLYKEIWVDLERAHDHAAERVGFTFGRTEKLDENRYVIVLNKYAAVSDEHYVEDSSVGAHINAEAIAGGMREGIKSQTGVFHTHKHWGNDIPQFSYTDLKSLPKLVRSFQVESDQIHGLFLLNEDGVNCLVWLPGISEAIYAEKIVVVGYNMRFIYPGESSVDKVPDQLQRQSFLGPKSHWLLRKAKVCIVGLGGGGSHIMQQLSHVGIGNFVLCDPDIVERTNLNRMVGSTVKDVAEKSPKVAVAKRLIKGVLPSSNVTEIVDSWENSIGEIHDSDVVVGCLDTVQGRRDLEAECRRFLIPLIDIGMDVHGVKPFDIRGQVILSMPGDCCFQCMEFITEENLKKEAERYGSAGGFPQVVWSNGVLASTAVGFIVDLITGWSNSYKNQPTYLTTETLQYYLGMSGQTILYSRNAHITT
jgi:tRNA A37 threonylcarbamoyladenosine dehydratase